MLELVECMLELRMLIDIGPEFVQGPPGLAEDAVKLGSSLCFGFRERHLDAAVGIDFALARSLDWQEDHVFKFVDYPRLHTVRLRGRHAAKGLERQHHVAEMVHGVVDVLAYFHLAVAAARQL